MRFNEFDLTDEQLFELKMSPKSLETMTKGIDAVAGIEFEMYVPNVSLDGTGEENYSNDPRPESIEEVIEFYEGYYNENLDSVRESMEEDYRDWLYEQCYREWQNEELTLNNLQDYIEEYVRNNFIGDDEDLEDEVKDALSDEDNGYTKDAMSQYYEENFDEYESDFIDENWWDWQSDWLWRTGYREMSDLTRGYDLNWPHYSDSGEYSISEVASEFENVVDSPVKYGSEYHSVGRDNVSYIIEPDSSLDSPDSNEDAGLEFISPPLKLPEMISDLEKIKKWAGTYGCYSNSTCGLHINISIEGVDHSKLDYMKLALFVGEKHVLEQFDRIGNDYCVSVLDKVSRKIAQDSSSVQRVFELMKQQLYKTASQLIHKGVTAHFDGLNVNHNYVEFRYAGNDWLSQDLSVIINTMNRYVVAYSIACDPDAHKEEYAKKLYKLLSKSDDDMNTLKYFSEYSAGKLPRSAMVSFVRNIQNKRTTKREAEKERQNKERRYIVKLVPERQQDITTFTNAVIMALSPDIALLKAKKYFNLDNVPNDWFTVEEDKKVEQTYMVSLQPERYVDIPEFPETLKISATDPAQALVKVRQLFGIYPNTPDNWFIVNQI